MYGSDDGSHDGRLWRWVPGFPSSHPAPALHVRVRLRFRATWLRRAHGLCLYGATRVSANLPGNPELRLALIEWLELPCWVYRSPDLFLLPSGLMYIYPRSRVRRVASTHFEASDQRALETKSVTTVRYPSKPRNSLDRHLGKGDSGQLPLQTHRGVVLSSKGDRSGPMSRDDLRCGARLVQSSEVAVSRRRERGQGLARQNAEPGFHEPAQSLC